LYPEEFLPATHAESHAVFESFIADLEVFLGFKRTSINLEEIWQKTKPVQTDLSLGDYFEHVFEWAANPDQWRNLLKPFLDEYENTPGQAPYLPPRYSSRGNIHVCISSKNLILI